MHGTRASLDQIKAIVAHLSETGAEPAGDDTALIDALNRVASPNGPAFGRGAAGGEMGAATAAEQTAADVPPDAAPLESAPADCYPCGR